LRSLFGLTLLPVLAGLVTAQVPEKSQHKTTPQVCRLVSAGDKNSNRFRFARKSLSLKQLNRFPKVSYVVNEDGSVTNVEILKGSGSPKVDADLVKGIQAWKYKPQPGCTFEMSMVVIIDIGAR
jgi:TonB family protein